MKKLIELDILGMTCNGCSSHIERDLNNANGVINSSVNHRTGKGNFEINDSVISKSEVINKVNNIGKYEVKKDLLSNTNELVETEFPKREETGNYDYDLIIIGGGSAAFSAMTTANDLGKSVLLINGGLELGGTCVNVGCVPSKHLIRAAESIHKASFSPFNGIKTNAPDIDFTRIIKDKRLLVNEMREKKYLKVANSVNNVTIIEGWSNFIDERTVEVNNKTYTASKFLISTGATTSIPQIEGLTNIGYLTNSTLFDLEEKPESLTILGAGYIGLEIAQAFSRLGVKIRILEFTNRVLSTQSQDISDELQKQLLNEGIDFYPNIRVEKLEKIGNQIKIYASNPNGELVEFIENGQIVISTGTAPNTSKMNIEKSGVKLTKTGHIEVNNKQETNVSHIFAAGDCTNTPAFVYTAATEGKYAVSNAFGTDNTYTSDYSALPWVVFTDPQVAGVGLDEDEAKAKGIPFESTKLPLDEVPRALAALDTRGFIKLIRNTETDKLIGARVVAPEGGELIMEAVLAIKYGISASELAETFHPYLTLGEGIKIAAITFKKDISELSCCAT